MENIEEEVIICVGCAKIVQPTQHVHHQKMLVAQSLLKEKVQLCAEAHRERHSTIIHYFDTLRTARDFIDQKLQALTQNLSYVQQYSTLLSGDLQNILRNFDYDYEKQVFTAKGSVPTVEKLWRESFYEETEKKRHMNDMHNILLATKRVVKTAAGRELELMRSQDAAESVPCFSKRSFLQTETEKQISSAQQITSKSKKVLLNNNREIVRVYYQDAQLQTEEIDQIKFQEQQMKQSQQQISGEMRGQGTTTRNHNNSQADETNRNSSNSNSNAQPNNSNQDAQDKESKKYTDDEMAEILIHAIEIGTLNEARRELRFTKTFLQRLVPRLHTRADVREVVQWHLSQREQCETDAWYFHYVSCEVKYTSEACNQYGLEDQFVIGLEACLRDSCGLVAIKYNTQENYVRQCAQMVKSSHCNLQVFLDKMVARAQNFCATVSMSSYHPRRKACDIVLIDD